MAEEPKFRWIEGKEPTPVIYTNFVHTSWTLFDVRFQLGQLVPVAPGASLDFAVQTQGAVSLAWPAAKNLRDTLVNLIDRYEETNGEIKPLKLVPAPEPKKENE